MTELVHAHTHTYIHIHRCVSYFGGFCLFVLNIYLFIWLLQLLVVVHGLLSSCGIWALESGVSVAVAHGLSCPAACGV